MVYVRYTFEDVSQLALDDIKQIRQKITDYGSIERALSPKMHTLVYIVSYEGDGWTAREWVDETQTNIMTYAHPTIERLTSEQAHELAYGDIEVPPRPSEEDFSSLPVADLSFLDERE